MTNHKLSLILVIIMALLPVLNTSAEGDSVATLEPLQGVVQLASGEAADWVTLTQPTEIKAGDRIRTGEAGWAVLTFFEGTLTELLANTEITVTALDLPTEDGDSFAVNYDLRIGDTFNTVSALLDQESEFEVTMPGMTASVRGTEWYSRVIPTGCSMVYTVEGEVATFSQLNADNPIGVEAGEFIVYAVDGTLDEIAQPEFPPQRPATAPLAPDTCGDGICSTEEAGVCDLDCSGDLSLPTCGDNICQIGEGEGLLTCSADCSSLLDVDEETRAARLEILQEQLEQLATPEN